MIPGGRKLILRGTHAVNLRVQGEVVIDGTIDLVGGAGLGGFLHSTAAKDTPGPKGGVPAAGGGKGADVGKYTYKQL